jgi:N-acetylglucosaminyldiphosphoundecaprenol N-acetyl-beta-D-mannosaminyltransferase
MSNPDMKEIVNSSQLVIPDGIGVEIGLKICGYNVKRIPGIQFAHRMIEECAKNGQKIAMIGAKPEIIEKATKNLKHEFESLDVAYVQDGYFEKEEVVLEQLQNSGARLVLCALGSPKQEIFIQKAKQLLPHTLFIGVGGSFDVWSGEVQRAPEIYQKLGLEWLYRTVKEPQRFKRIFPTLPLFVLKVLRERFIPKGV